MVFLNQKSYLSSLNLKKLIINFDLQIKTLYLPQIQVQFDIKLLLFFLHFIQDFLSFYLDFLNHKLSYWVLKDILPKICYFSVKPSQQQQKLFKILFDKFKYCEFHQLIFMATLQELNHLIDKFQHIQPIPRRFMIQLVSQVHLELFLLQISIQQICILIHKIILTQHQVSLILL